MDSLSHPALLLVDGVSSIGGLDFQMDQWKVDMAVTGSQKALSLPTGLAVVAVSPKVRAHIQPGYPISMQSVDIVSGLSVVASDAAASAAPAPCPGAALGHPQEYFADRPVRDPEAHGMLWGKRACNSCTAAWQWGSKGPKRQSDNAPARLVEELTLQACSVYRMTIGAKQQYSNASDFHNLYTFLERSIQRHATRKTVLRNMRP